MKSKAALQEITDDIPHLVVFFIEINARRWPHLTFPKWIFLHRQIPKGAKTLNLYIEMTLLYQETLKNHRKPEKRQKAHHRSYRR